MRRNHILGTVALAVAVALVAYSWWATGQVDESRQAVLAAQPQGVMGTSCNLMVVIPQGQQKAGQQALQEAERALRHVEAKMSTWLAESEMGRLNRASAGEIVPLSPESLAVLGRAREVWEETSGAFDITARPLFELWKEAGQTGELPTAEAIVAARELSSWPQIVLEAAGARKLAPTARVDLGGIAKGYGIDLAVERMQMVPGVVGGLVDVGGDLRVFGLSPRGTTWRVEIRNPFEEGLAGHILIDDGAVATSGDYARFVEIAGKRYSHIVNPQTGRPAEGVPSVTVLAPSAMQADVWATALSVLGSAGLEKLPEDVQALLVLSDDESARTQGFPPVED